MALDTTRPVLQTVGNYDLLEKIAEGGMGTVYRARERPNGQIVAIKIVPPHMVHNPVLLKRFEQEYNAASVLDHPNIVRALAFGYHGASPYLVMEFVEGESLGQRLERDQRISEAESIRIIAQVAQGLHKAHKQGLIHRDVKPDNILITPDGAAKLADLGLVKELESDLNLTRTNRGLGTPHFMAPEQFRNAKNADARCDIYSMAATLYMMVTGVLPFKSCGPLDAWMKKIENKLPAARELVPELSERVDWAIRRAMSADPNQRPASCREFVEDLTGHSTRKVSTAELVTEQDIWYLMFKDEEDVVNTIRGNLGSIRRSLKEGRLGDASNVRASRCKTGPYEALRLHPEFRDLVVEPAPLTPVRVNKPSAVTTQPAVPSTPSVSTMPPLSSPSRETGRINKLPTLPPPSVDAPHISFDGNSDDGEWIKWLLLAVVVAFAAGAGYTWFPQILDTLRNLVR